MDLESVASGRKRKLEKKWTAEDDRIMVEMIEEREAIWNSCSAVYKNREVKSKSWGEIAEKINHSVFDAKNRWNIIKSRYNSERNKVLTYKRGKGTYQPKFELYAKLQFLAKVSGRPAGIATNLINIRCLRMVTKSRDERMETFLDLYRENECLWNISNESYKSKAAREVAYRNICLRMNLPDITISDVKNKIKIIRTNYKLELNKIIKSKKNNNNSSMVYVPRLFWFKKADAFLRSVCEAKETIANLSFKVDSNSQLSNVSLQKKLHEESLRSIADKHGNSDNTNTAPRLMSTTLHAKAKPKRNHETRKRSYKMIALEKSINKLRTISEICKKGDDDEFDFFGKSIAVQLKKMPLERALICQENLQAVIKQERLYQLNYGVSSYTQGRAQCNTPVSADQLSAPTSPSCSDVSHLSARENNV